MKKFWSLVCACAMVLGMIPAMTLSVSAATSGDYVDSGDYQYYLRYDNTVSISKYYGSATTLTVPSKIDGRKVVAISMDAFKNCKTLKSVTIPSTVTNISSWAFDGCSALQTVSIPAAVNYIGDYALTGCPSLTTIKVNSSNPYYCVVNGVLFTKNKKTLMQYPAGKTATAYTIPSGVTTIGDNAFKGAIKLTSVSIPSSVTTIESEAFSGCSALKSVTVPSSVKTIKAQAFADCDSLKTFKFPSGVTELADQVCYDCDLLTTVTLPSAATVIGYRAFDGCDSLTGVTIPSKVTLIEFGAFRYCVSLTSISIPKSVATLEGAVFFGCSALKSVSVASGVVSVGNSIFYACDSLTSVKLPNTVKTLGTYAFSNCESLKSVTLSSKLTAIANGTFDSCKALASVTIPSGVTSIGTYAFSGCDSLSTVTIPNSVESIGSSAFYSCDTLAAVTLSNKLKAIDDSTFSGCKALTKVTVPSKVTTIGQYAFAWCDALTAVVLPKTVTKIGYAAFGNYISLQNVYYAGSEAQWNAITVEDSNDSLSAATKHYNYIVAEITSESSTASYATNNQYASVKVTAVGNGITYTWYVKDTVDDHYFKSSIATATYKAKMTSATSGRLAYCIVRDQYGNEVRSKTFVLRRKAAISSVPATVAYAKKGATASIKIGATGDGLKYTWYIRNDGASKYSKSSVTSATYATKMNSTSKDRLVYCIVKDKYGNSVRSKTFLVREAVSITTQPKNAYAASGKTAKVTVKASGDGLKYTWYVKDAGKTKYVKSSVTKASYSTTMNSKSKNRLLYCVVKDKYGKSVKSTTVQLRLK